MRRSSFVINVAQSQVSENDWVCSGCWNTWKRNRKPVKDNHDADTGPEWFADFMESVGVDVAGMAPLNQAADDSIDKLIRRLEKELSTRPDASKQAKLDKIKLKPKKIK